MSDYKFDSIVSRSEADALKEMIFKRARERAEALNQDIQTSYVSDIQSDVMDIARDSFTSTKNPFAQKVETQGPVENKKNEEIGFSQKHVENLKAEIEYRNKTVRDRIVNKESEANMQEAHSQLYNKKSFTGALDFLNSQASMLLVANKGKKFEALA